MRDWKAMAQAQGPGLSSSELERVVAPLNALEKVFRPLVADLTPDLEPDVWLRLPEGDE